MRAVAALVAITVLLVAGPFAGPALAAPGAPPAPTPAGAGPLALQLDQLSPRTVTAGGPDTLTISGTLTNTGDEPVGDLAVRVQRGKPLRTQGELRDALDGRAPADAVTPQFVTLLGELAPGGQMPVQLTVPLRGAPETGLALSETGVHELLVNVNAVPRGGSRARLAAVRLLLPVLSLPPDRGGQPPRRAAGPAPAPFTLLYPVADAPRRLPTVPGEPVLLTDDDLADSLAPAGRLGGLVSALAARAPVGSRVRDATCLAVDPDLVQTAAAMSQGYQVRAADGSTTPGRGAQVAGQWLEALVATTRGGCVLALPFADADLVALTRGGRSDLAALAVTDGRAILSDALGTPPLADTTWPVDGVLDETTLTQAVAPGGRAVVLSAEGVTPGRGPRSTGVLRVGTGGQTPQLGVLTDPLLTLAAAGPNVSGGPARTDQTGVVAVTATPAGTTGPLSTQDLIGALAFRAQTGAAQAGPTEPGTASDAPLVLAPPHQWAADGTGAGELLVAVDQLLGSGRLLPRGLRELVTAQAREPVAQSLVYPLRAGGREVPQDVVATVGTVSGDVVDLRSATIEDSPVGADPDEVFAPLLHALVRPASSAWRGRPGLAAVSAAAVSTRIGELRSAVRVLEPPSPYSLGTTDAPLLLTVANGLPIAVRVRVELSSTSGLRVAPIPEQPVPPFGRRQVQVSAELVRSGQFVVEAAVRTPDGGLLGPPSQLKVRSTAYGPVTVWLTGIAGVLLVVLAARRILRRIRREPRRRVDPDRAARTASDPQPPSPALRPAARNGAVAPALPTLRRDRPRR